MRRDPGAHPHSKAEDIDAALGYAVWLAHEEDAHPLHTEVTAPELLWGSVTASTTMPGGGAVCRSMMDLGEGRNLPQLSRVVDIHFDEPSNAGLLPPGFFAMAEQVIGGRSLLRAIVYATYRGRLRAAGSPAPPPPGCAPPSATPSPEGKRRPRRQGQPHRCAPRPGHVVAVIETWPPGNKKRTPSGRSSRKPAPRARRAPLIVDLFLPACATGTGTRVDSDDIMDQPVRIAAG